MPPLEIARLALLVAHFFGLAALIGPYLLQVRSQSPPRIRLMFIAALIVQRRRGPEAASVRSLVHVGGGFAIANLVVAVVWT